MNYRIECGRWQDVLADAAQVDCIAADPPYGAHCHKGNTGLRRFVNAGSTYKTLTDLTYQHWTPDDVREFVASWSPRCTGWMACMTSDDLIPVWRQAYADAGRLDFAPVPCLQHRPRMGGDGPGSGTVYLMVARPRRKEFLSWGSLPCWYGPIWAPGSVTSTHIGGKPLSLMLEILRDYSRPGQLVCDPCGGAFTTGVAAIQTGRGFVGAECAADTFAKGKARLEKSTRQGGLFAAGDLERQRGLSL